MMGGSSTKPYEGPYVMPSPDVQKDFVHVPLVEAARRQNMQLELDRYTLCSLANWSPSLPASFFV